MQKTNQKLIFDISALVWNWSYLLLWDHGGFCWEMEKKVMEIGKIAEIKKNLLTG